MWGQLPSAARRAKLGSPMKRSHKLGGSWLKREVWHPSVSYPSAQYPTVSSTSRSRPGTPVSLGSAGYLSVGRTLIRHSRRQLSRINNTNTRNLRCAKVECANLRNRQAVVRSENGRRTFEDQIFLRRTRA
jgi:hypothetical protein